ncbi:MAG: tetratricopeptide repeat protein [Acidimicrobiales bacterium]
MPDVELEAPELDVDERAPEFRRRVAVVVVLITLFGSIVAYLQAVESNREENAARDAQVDAIAGLATQVDASAALTSDIRIESQSQALLRRQAINAGRAGQASGNQVDIFQAAADRFGRVREAIVDASPLLGDEPQDRADRQAELDERPDRARLEQAVEAARANDHGGKADTYVAVLTVLAVGLFLIGLSLTVQRARFVLLAPGVVVAVVCVGWTVVVNGRHVTTVSAQSVRLAAEGERLRATGDFEAAIEAFDRAIDGSPDFGAAYARRGTARFISESPQLGQTGFISLTTDEALEAAVADVEEAVERGEDDDVNTMASLGFYLFLDGQFDRAVEVTEEALDLNGQLPEVWFNLGVAQVAQDDDAARRAYRQGMRLLEDVEPARRTEVLAAARTDLSILRDVIDNDELDDVEDLARDLEIELSMFELELDLPPCREDLECPEEPDVGDDAEALNFGVGRFDSFIDTFYEVRGIGPNTPVINVWYFRPDDSQPFVQTALPTETRRVGSEFGEGFGSAITSLSTDPLCPVPGEYRVDVYAGDRLIGFGSDTVEAGPLGADYVQYIDQIEGVSFCQPAGFVESVEQVEGITGDVTFFRNEELGINVVVDALPGGGAGAPPQDADAFITEVAGEPVELFDTDMVGFSLETNDQVILPARAANFSDGSVAIAVGDDNVARIAVVFGTDDPEVLEDLLDLLIFTGIPAVDDSD